MGDRFQVVFSKRSQDSIWLSWQIPVAAGLARRRQQSESVWYHGDLGGQRAH
jgi:hypothetical protein